MKTLLTGSSGFLGKYFLVSALKTGQCSTLGRSSTNDYQCDLTENIPYIKTRFDQVIHCAGKAHVIPKSRSQTLEFEEVNYKGTKKLLQSLSRFPPKQFIFISSVTVYGLDYGNQIDEKYPLDGTTSFALSKIKSEADVLHWGQKYDVNVMILRLPLLVGKDPKGNLGKMIAGIQSGKYISIAKGKAKRSMVLAEDVVDFVMRNPTAHGIYNLTDGCHPSFREIEKTISIQLNKKIPWSISEFWAKVIGYIGNMIPGSPVNSSMINKFINDLTFDDKSARNDLNWSPRKVIDHFDVRH
ncbi:MAG: nucleoside-diphosphate-sugar epimerase [Psychroserpens sp.]|jgi:nucleoside-diphosphate-sugar epimerase